MRSDNFFRHMKIHLKFSAEEASEKDICKQILLELVNNVVSGVNIEMVKLMMHTDYPNKNATGFLLYWSGNTQPTRLRLYSFEN